MNLFINNPIVNFITSTIRYKIMFFLFLLITISSFATMYITVKQIEKNNVVTTEKYLGILNESIFQSLRNAMNTGDPALIKKALDDARDIQGVKKLDVARSKSLIELYSPDTKYTQDKAILNSFKTKKIEVIEYKQPSHDLRMIKPMIATQECLMCHANQSEGDVIGTIDLVFSLEDSDNELTQIISEIFIVSTILGWITLLIVFFVLKQNTQPIKKLQEAIKNLRTSNNSTNTIDIKMHDEIGEVAKDFNEYIKSINQTLIEDKIVIDDAKNIIDKVKHGWYSDTINSSTSNKSVEELKNSVNEMIVATKEHFVKVNKSLKQFVEYDYSQKIELSGIEKEGVFQSLIDDINELRDSITQMLLQNQSNGTSLENSSHVLLQNVNSLNKNSNESAAALEETAAALEQITSNISSNTSNIIKMAEFANNVTQSASTGKRLASDTTQAMNDIDIEVNSINEAITIIDQIAFQTNILSLNAAVEAATAGEAGKGFAVVAQEVRNLASRSAEAANEIKKLVFNATEKTNNGKLIAEDMINGYTELNNNIQKTIELINDVEMASKEQLAGIEQINNAVNDLDRQTQENATIAGQTQEIAINTDKIAKMIVEDVDSKEFVGKI